jgi:HSP20 family protein
MAAKHLGRRDPFRELINLRDDMDRLFDTFFGRTPQEADGFWSPTIDIEEDSENYCVKAELPGMKKDDIKISVRGNLITLSGERKHTSEMKMKTFHRIERSYGKFSRTITLPSDVDSDTVKATYKDGILTVILPKPESTKPKEIEVEIK